MRFQILLQVNFFCCIRFSSPFEDSRSSKNHERVHQQYGVTSQKREFSTKPLWEAQISTKSVLPELKISESFIVHRINFWTFPNVYINVILPALLGPLSLLSIRVVLPRVLTASHMNSTLFPVWFTLKKFWKSGGLNSLGNDIGVTLKEWMFLLLTWDPNSCHQFSSQRTPFQAAHKSWRVWHYIFRFFSKIIEIPQTDGSTYSTPNS